MQNPNIIDPLPAGAMSWTGKTQGPAICMGRLRPHVLGPRVLWLTESEHRDNCAKFGYPMKEDYERALAKLDEKNDQLADADARISELEDENDALRRAIGFKPAETQPKAAPKKKVTK